MKDSTQDKQKVYKLSRILLTVAFLFSIIAALVYRTYVQNPSYPKWLYTVVALPAFGTAAASVALPVSGVISSSGDKSVDSKDNTSLFTTTVLTGSLLIVTLLLRMYLGNHFGAFGANGYFEEIVAQEYKNYYTIIISTILSMIVLFSVPLGFFIYQGKLMKKVFGSESSEVSKLKSDSTNKQEFKGRRNQGVWDVLVTFFILRTIIPFFITFASIPLNDFILDYFERITKAGDTSFESLVLILIFMSFTLALCSILVQFASPYLVFVLGKHNKDKEPISKSVITIFNISAWFGVLYSFVTIIDTFTTIQVPAPILLLILVIGALFSLATFVLILITFVNLNKIESEGKEQKSEVNTKVNKSSGGIA